MPTVRLAANGLGSVLNGLYGTYVVQSDGTVTVDTRDAASYIADGASYLTNRQGNYNTFPTAPLVAAVGQIVASGSLSNGTISISNQPDVMRQVYLSWNNGTAPISAGNAAVTYVANDGESHTENVNLALIASGLATHYLSRGVTSISPVVVTGLTGGTAPTRRMGTTTYLAVPVDPLAQDVHTVAEAADGVFETGGWTDSTVSIGCVAPLTAPGTTHTFSMFYIFVAPVV